MEISTTMNDPELPSAETVSVSSSASSSSSPHANNHHNENNDLHDSAQRFRDSDVRPAAMMPKWLQELNAVEPQQPVSSGSNHSSNSRTKSRDSILPDWLQELEAEQEKLLQAMTSRTSILSRSSSCHPSTMDTPNPNMPPEAGPNPNMAPEGTLNWNYDSNNSAVRQPSVAPDWLKGFEAEQLQLLQAMNRRASMSSRRQDSFAMLQEEESEEEEEGDAEPQQQEEDANPFELIKEIEQQQKTLLQALGKRATILAETTGIDVLVATQEPTTKSDEPSSNRPSVIPDWLLEFEKQQKTLLKALDSHSRASMMLGDSIFLAAAEANTTTTTSSSSSNIREDNHLEPSSRHSNASILSAPDWFKEFEKRQNNILDDLKSSTHHSTRNGEWDASLKGEDSMAIPNDGENFDEEEDDPIAKVLFHPKDISKPKPEVVAAKSPARPSFSASLSKLDTTTSDPFTTPSKEDKKNHNSFSCIPLRKTPTSVERQKKESNLEFAEMVANALTKRNRNSIDTLSLEALRHIHSLKEEVAQLQQQSESGTELWQIHKLRTELLELFDRAGTAAGAEQSLLNWLLPMHQERDLKTGQLVMNADQVSLLQAFTTTSDELNMVSGLGMVKSVLQSNFKAIDGTSCLDTIREYAVLKLGKSKKKQVQKPWEILAEIFETAQQEDDHEDCDQDIHLRVRNALVTWVVREILGSSRDKVSSRMCFHAIFLVASLKLELERVAPAALRKSETHSLCKSIGNENTPVEQKRDSRRKGLLAKAPSIVKKLLNRDLKGPKDAPLVPLDLPPEDENALSGSNKVDFVRETLVTGLEDKMEEQAKITSRTSTFVKINSDKAIDDDAVANAVKAFKLPTNLDEDSMEFSTPNYPLRRSTILDETPKVEALEENKESTVGNLHDSTTPAGQAYSATDHQNEPKTDVASSNQTSSLAPTDPRNESTSHLEEEKPSEIESSSKSNDDSGTPHEDEANLPSNIQDAHRVIRTILGPAHPNITVSLCFEAIRVYATLITTWRNVCAEDGTLLENGVKVSTAGPRPSEEELKLKSLEGTILRRGAIVPAAEINLQLEMQKQQEREKQEEEERRAREEIARKREEKKRKKIVRKRTHSPAPDSSPSGTGQTGPVASSQPGTTSSTNATTPASKMSAKSNKRAGEKKKNGSTSRKPQKKKKLKNLARRLTMRPKKSKGGDLGTVQE